MTKSIFIVLSGLVSLTVFGQGQVHFDNRLPIGDAGIWFIRGTFLGIYDSAQNFTATPDSMKPVVYGPTPETFFPNGWTAELDLVGSNGSLTQLATTQLDGYFLNPKIVTVPGIDPGEPATLRIRAWATEYGSFDSAAMNDAIGFSNDVLVDALGGTDGNGTTFEIPYLADVNNPFDPTRNLQAFGVFVPEPSVIALSVAGGLGLLLFGRNKTCRNRRL